MAALDRQHQVARRGDVGGDHVHVDAEARAEHAARIADAVDAVERIADRQRMQHGAAVAHRMPAAGGEHAGDVALGDGRADDIDGGGEQLARRAGRPRPTPPPIRAAPRHALGERRRPGGSLPRPRRDRPRAPAFMPRASVWPKPTTSTAWLRRRSTSCGACGLQPRDQAGDLAGADVERGDQRRAPRRQRLHLRRQAVLEGVHALPPFFGFLSLSASSRACAARPTAAPSRGRAAADRSRRCRATGASCRGRARPAVSSAGVDVVFRQPHVEAVLQPQVPAPFGRPGSRRAPARGCRDSDRATARNSLACASAPRADDQRQAEIAVARRTARARCRRRRSRRRVPSFCQSAKASRSVIADLQPAGIELEHGGVGDPRIGLSRARAASTSRNSSEDAAGDAGGGRESLRG